MGQSHSSTNNPQNASVTNSDISDIDTLNWNDFNTEDINNYADNTRVTYTLPNQVSNLIGNLNIPSISSTESDTFIPSANNKF
jgi:hypothetical protein